MRSLFSLLCTLLFLSTFGQTHPEYYQMARIAKTQLDFKGAAKMMTEALEIDPTNTTYLVERGNIYLGLEKYEDARKDFETAMRVDSMSVDPWIGRSFYHLFTGNKNEALNDAQIASILANTAYEEAKAGSALGEVYISHGEDETALKYLKKSLLLDTTNTTGYKKAALVYLKRKEFPDAERVLLKALKNDERDLEILINLAFVYNQMAYYMQAIEYCNLALTLDNQQPLALSNRAFAYSNMGQKEKALEDINRSLRNDNRNPLAYRYKGEILLKIDPSDDQICKSFERAEKFGYSEVFGNTVEKLISLHCETD